MPWRLLAAPCLVTLFGGAVFYALIVELSFVLNGLGVDLHRRDRRHQRRHVAGDGRRRRRVRPDLPALAPGPAADRVRAVAPSAWCVVFATTSLVVVTLGAVITGFGTGMLLPTLLTWAVNRLSFEQRGRGTGLWTGSLFLGEFLAPLVIAGIGVGVGGLQPALAVLGVAAAVMAVVTWLALRGRDEPLNTGHL